MWAEVIPDEDTTTLYLRWEILPEGRETKALKALGGPLVLAVAAREYVDPAGKHYDHTWVDVPIYPHAGHVNRGQAKFTDVDARRAFWELLVGAVNDEVASFVWEAKPGSVDVEGHVIRVGDGPALEDDAEAAAPAEAG